MLRDTWFWEVEIVRLDAGEQTKPARRLDFSVRPLNYLVGLSLAGAAALTAAAGLIYCLPEPEPVRWGSHCCSYHVPDLESFHYTGCGVPFLGQQDVIKPLRQDGDTTLLVRRPE